MAKKRKLISVMDVYAVAAVWAVYSLCFPLYQTKHFIWVILLSLLAKKAAKKIWKPRYEELPPAPEKPQVEEAPAEEPKKPEGTGNEELDAFILEGRRAVSEMNRLNDNIADEEISRRISRLTELTGKIFAHVSAHPHKLTRARKFVNYYVPTTIKILNAYDRMGSQGVSGEHIGSTMRKIEDILDAVVAAYEKQLDSLFSEEAMDISADITVLEGMMEREGFSGPSFDLKG
ncbi:MAG: hypothetical protein E7458_01645 [Ruminococcaceae bacterium]|nr:hypothetical protein [Oscillospiraceae bacterium]